jgi:gluconokinase
VGVLSSAAARLTGLPAGLPVVAGTSDGGAANVGTGAHLPGQNVITVGTSGAVRCLISQPYLDDRERTWCYLLFEGRWFAGGAINNAGLAVQWVREKFYPDLPGKAGFAQLFQDAAAAPAGAGGLIFLPYFTGERNPHWDTSARAMMAGLGLEHSRAHIARAVLEGVAFCLADVWEALDNLKSPNKLSSLQPPILLTGGITQSPLWAQIVSDVLNVRLAAVENGDASATGAAILGHYAVQNALQKSDSPLSTPSLDALVGRIQTAASWSPDPARHALYRPILERFRALYSMGVKTAAP